MGSFGNINIMKAVLLCRVSSKEQEESGYSLEAQEKLGKEYATKNDITILEIFSISESASGRKQRQIYNQMMDYVAKNDVQTIICEKVDRLTRNGRDAVIVNDWMDGDENRTVHFIKENLVMNKNSKSHEKFMLNVKVSVAQFFTDNLSEEVRKGQGEKLAQGWYPGQAKLGYKTIESNDHKIPVPDDEQGLLVKKALELFATGEYSIQKLANTMYEEGLRSKKGFKVVSSRIYGLLLDPFYCGKFIWSKQLHQGKHEPLITQEVYDKNQALLKRKNAPKYTVHNYLFKGLAHCVGCDHAITWEKQKEVLYGYCNRYKPCNQVQSIKEEDIETQLLDCLHKFQIKNTRIVEWVRKAIKEGHKDEVDYHKNIIQDLNQRLTQAQKRLDNLLDMKVDEKIDEETYQRKFTQYSTEKDKITDSIQKHSRYQVKHVEYSVSFYELSQRAKEIYLKAKKKKMVEEQRRLLRLMFASLIVEPNTKNLTYTYTKPFQMLTELVELTNNSKATSDEVKKPKTFELPERIDLPTQTGDFLYAYPEMRRG